MKKGFATSAIIYTLLLLFLVLLIGILSNTQSRKMILDELKNETKQQLEDSNETDICDIELGTSWDFVYQGKVAEWTASCDGIYKLEVWGSQGGTSNSAAPGGKGGYSYGNISLNKDQSLYIVVGGIPYNGGGQYGDNNGNTYTGATSGGGATHIAITDHGELKNYSSYQSDVIIVAGGGGGSVHQVYLGSEFIGGTGGGTTGGTNNNNSAQGGSQTNGGWGCGNNGTFGQGGKGKGSCGGGGGWYGGGGACDYYGGGGGSGYLNMSWLIAGTTETKNGVQSGNGKAKITLESYN